MKKCIRHARFRVVAAAVATTLATVCVRRAEAQAVWNGGIGNWNTAANWSTNLVPNSGTTNVFIDFNQTAVSSIVNLDINATVNNLTIDAGDRLNFNAGTSSNVNGYTSVDGLLSVGSNGGGAAFINFTATNSQSIFGPGEVLFGATNYTVRNNTGNNTVGLGIFMHGENAVFSGNSPQGFLNTGTIAADVAGGTFVFNSGISNDGILRAQNGGTLILNGGGNAIGGTFTANVGSTLTFNTGYGLDHSSAINGAGTVSISGGTVLMGGSYNVAGVTQINGGALSINTSAASTGALSFSSGVLAGTGAVSVSGLTTWTGGQFGNGVAGGTTTAGGGLLIGGSPTKALNGYRLVNPGTATWSGAGNITLFNAAVLDNRGTFNATNDALINSGGGSQTFANSGIFNKSSAVNGATVIGIDFNNSGTVNVNSGTLDLSSASFTQSSGSINLLGGNVSGGLSLVGGLLTGSGTIIGNITVGGTISPGSGAGSIGRLSIVGNVTLTGGAHFVADLNGSNSTDQLAIVGNLDLSGTNDILDINSAGADFSNSNSFIIATYTGSLTGVFDHIPAGLTVTYQTQSHQIVVTPEPTSMAMVAVGLTLLSRRRRRRLLKT